MSQPKPNTALHGGREPFADVPTKAPMPPVEPMLPDVYQELASRTEAPQIKALKRIAHSFGGFVSFDNINDVPNSSDAVLQTRALHAAIGMSGEAGEFCSLLQKNIWYGKPLDTTNAKEELGDMMWYVALACNALGFSLEDVMRSNIAKLRARFPDKFTEKAAADENRDREAERQAVGNRAFAKFYGNREGHTTLTHVPAAQMDEALPNLKELNNVVPLVPACQYCDKAATKVLTWNRGELSKIRPVMWCGECSLNDALRSHGICMTAPIVEGEYYTVADIPETDMGKVADSAKHNPSTPRA